jgi:hypothetical protein
VGICRKCKAHSSAAPAKPATSKPTVAPVKVGSPAETRVKSTVTPGVTVGAGAATSSGSHGNPTASATTASEPCSAYKGLPYDTAICENCFVRRRRHALHPPHPPAAVDMTAVAPVKVGSPAETPVKSTVTPGVIVGAGAATSSGSQGNPTTALKPGLSKSPVSIPHPPFAIETSALRCAHAGAAWAALKTLGIDGRLFNHDFDKCYCEDCERVSRFRSDGKGSIPCRYTRFALHVEPNQAMARQVFSSWPKAFHGTNTTASRVSATWGICSFPGPLRPMATKLTCAMDI